MGLARHNAGHTSLNELSPKEVLDFNNKSSFSDMLVTCFQYMGFSDVTSFGDARLALTGTLPNVT